MDERMVAFVREPTLRPPRASESPAMAPRRGAPELCR
jgi:hypothetical protein